MWPALGKGTKWHKKSKLSYYYLHILYSLVSWTVPVLSWSELPLQSYGCFHFDKLIHAHTNITTILANILKCNFVPFGPFSQSRSHTYNYSTSWKSLNPCHTCLGACVTVIKSTCAQKAYKHTRLYTHSHMLFTRNWSMECVDIVWKCLWCRFKDFQDALYMYITHVHCM